MQDQFTLAGEGLVGQLFELMERLDKLTEEFSSAEAEFKKLDKLEKHTLAVLQGASGGKSEAEKSRKAYSNEAYMKWFWSWDGAQKKYLKLRAQREALQIRIDATRSALAFNKEMISLAK